MPIRPEDWGKFNKLGVEKRPDLHTSPIDVFSGAVAILCSDDSTYVPVPKGSVPKGKSSDEKLPNRPRARSYAGAEKYNTAPSRNEHNSDDLLVSKFNKNPNSRYPERIVVENVTDNLLDEFLPVASNEAEARLVVKLAEHQRLRRRQERLAKASQDYRKSLRQFNLCGTCFFPITTKVHRIESGSELGKLTPTTVEFADIPAHWLVVAHKTIAGQYEVKYVPKARVFNLKCGCGK